MPRIAKSLDRLREQVHGAFPNGPPLSEYGWIGDTAHANRVSDHNPDELGIVRALDIPHAPKIGLDSYELANHLRDKADPRIKYLISNRRIWNPAISKAWRVYTKGDPHEGHLHVSAVGTALADDLRDWDLGDLGRPAEELPPVRPMLQRGATGEDVRLLQQVLMVDGVFGALTEQAVRRFQAREEIDDDGIVGPMTWRALQFRYPELFVELPPVEPSEWRTNITATVFKDTTTAYDENHAVTDTEYGVSLPYRFAKAGRVVQAHNLATNKAVNAPVMEVGPWVTDDEAYVIGGERPMVEHYYRTKTPLPRGPNKGEVPTNDAAIDFTPAAADALGLDGKGKVNWRFVS